MPLGVPTAIHVVENRVALTPNEVAEHTRRDRRARIVRGPEVRCGFANIAYNAAGVALVAAHPVNAATFGAVPRTRAATLRNATLPYTQELINQGLATAVRHDRAVAEACALPATPREERLA